MCRFSRPLQLATTWLVSSTLSMSPPKRRGTFRLPAAAVHHLLHPNSHLCSDAWKPFFTAPFHQCSEKSRRIWRAQDQRQMGVQVLLGRAIPRASSSTNLALCSSSSDAFFSPLAPLLSALLRESHFRSHQLSSSMNLGPIQLLSSQYLKYGRRHSNIPLPSLPQPTLSPPSSPHSPSALSLSNSTLTQCPLNPLSRILHRPLPLSFLASLSPVFILQAQQQLQQQPLSRLPPHPQVIPSVHPLPCRCRLQTMARVGKERQMRSTN